jgi:hypothetical protein
MSEQRTPCSSQCWLCPQWDLADQKPPRIMLWRRMDRPIRGMSYPRLELPDRSRDLRY